MKKNTVVGVVGLKKNYLRTFYVDPKSQGQGIGSALFNTVKRLVVRRGFATMIVHGNPFAVPIYQHFGFRRLRQLRVTEGRFTYEDTLMFMRLGNNLDKKRV